MNELENIDWTKIVSRLEQFATCELSRQELERIRPLKTIDECLKSFKIIEEAKTVISSGPRPFFESLDLFSTWHPRLKRSAILKNRELRDVRTFCIEVLALIEVLEPFETPWVEEIKNRVLNVEVLIEEIDQILTPDGEIRPDASETLKKLLKEKKNLSGSIQTTLDKIVKDNQLESVLQDRYVTNREGRWVLPVKSGMRHEFEGIIHASSQSRQTVFMEPREIIPSNNRLRQIEVEIEDEIEHLLTRLSLFLHSQVDDLGEAKKWALEADIRFSQARLSIQLKSCPCDFSDDLIELIDLKNPLLVLDNEEVIENSVTMKRGNQVLLLSGPNAGGKTVLLKSIGLAAQMARCGLPICASPESKLPFIKRFFVGVGDHQSIGAHLSTFAAHLEVLNNATTAKGFSDLILIDEICGATDPEEGAALARSFIETYVKNGPFAVITSHFGALKKDWNSDSGVLNGSLEFSPMSGPTYLFIPGVPGQSLAIQTADRIGVDKQIVERAKELLSPEAKRYQQEIKEIETYKQEVLRLREELLTEKKAYNKKKSAYEVQIQKFEKEKQQLLEKSVKKAEKEVDTMIQHAKVDHVFKKHEGLQKIKADLPKVIKSTSKATDIQSAEEFIAAFPPGTKVFVEVIGKDGVIQGQPNSKGEIPILSSSMRLSVPWKSLRPSVQNVKSTQQILRNRVNVQVSPLDDDRVIDVRGKVVEEAIEHIERMLDQAMINQEDRVKIIHGHGTSDTLKRAIRSYLSRSLYIKKWQAGNKDTGGDGVTWAEIGDEN